MKRSIKTILFLYFFSCSITMAMGDSLEAEKDTKHYVVYYEKGKFAGWPANNGAWIFDGDEILVGFTRGNYQKRQGDHNIDHNGQESWLARSEDGGKTWNAYHPKNYVGTPQDKITPLEKPIDFTHPKFALRVVGAAYHCAYDGKAHFFYSYDGGKTWQGPHRFGKLHEIAELRNAKLEELTPRTDYIVLGKHEALVIMSARQNGKFATDKLFCARTRDGGKTFEFVSWVVPTDDPARAVMSQTIQRKDGTLLTVMRRRKGEANWVDAYGSKDGGKTWQFVARVGGTGSNNGNPPALAETENGRLCVVYGERAIGAMLVTYSSDDGKTWSKPTVLRKDFGSEDNETLDMGYPRLVRRSDGKMVALYYYSTKDCLHHLAATIWDPDATTQKTKD